VTRRALVADGSGSGDLTIGDVPDAEPRPGEVVIDVHAISVNRGELHRVRSAPAGWIPGWDLAGVVSSSSESALPPGTRVVGTLPSPGCGAWAEVVSVPSTQVAPLPDAVSFAQAATLPVAGLTALRALRLGGSLLGRRVVITGAAGGVGRFAVQLAHLAGASVTAIAGSTVRARGLVELGADAVVTSVTDIRDRYDLILESSGGSSLAHLVSHIEDDGTLVMFGNSSGETTTFDVRDVYMGRAVRLQGFSLPTSYRADPPARDLAYLAMLVGTRHLDTQVVDELPWEQVGTALRRLEERSVAGKIVLAVR
jgi:NADPH:quinone reductase